MLSSNRICGPTHFKKALNLIFPKLSSQNMYGFDHSTILSPSFSQSPQRKPGTMTYLLYPKYDEKRVADYEFCCLHKRDWLDPFKILFVKKIHKNILSDVKGLGDLFLLLIALPMHDCIKLERIILFQFWSLCFQNEMWTYFVFLFPYLLNMEWILKLQTQHKRKMFKHVTFITKKNRHRIFLC